MRGKSNFVLMGNGDIISITELSQRAGVTPQTIQSRLDRGESPEIAASYGPWQRPEAIYQLQNGEIGTIREFCKRRGVRREIVRGFLISGMSLDTALREAVNWKFSVPPPPPPPPPQSDAMLDAKVREMAMGGDDD